MTLPEKVAALRNALEACSQQLWGQQAMEDGSGDAQYEAALTNAATLEADVREVVDALAELVDRRDRVAAEYVKTTGVDRSSGSDDRYTRARAALKKARP